MVSIYDVNPNELIEKTAERLKKIEQIKPPEWADFVKTGRNRERPPVEKDWWFTRTAAVLRSVYKLGPVGVSKLKTKYGGRKNRGVKPERFYRSSGNILRKILQQLESAELVKKGEAKGHKGRVIAPKGASILSKAALEIRKGIRTSKKIVKETPQQKKKLEKKAVKEEKAETKKAEVGEEKSKEIKKEEVEEKTEPKEAKKQIEETVEKNG